MKLCWRSFHNRAPHFSSQFSSSCEASSRTAGDLRPRMVGADALAWRVEGQRVGVVKGAFTGSRSHLERPGDPSMPASGYVASQVPSPGGAPSASPEAKHVLFRDDQPQRAVRRMFELLDTLSAAG
jgi:hypothetical protein